MPDTARPHLADDVSVDNPPTHVTVRVHDRTDMIDETLKLKLDEEVDLWNDDGTPIDEHYVSDDMADEIFDEIVSAWKYTAAWEYLDSGDVYVLAFLDIDGQVGITHTYGREGVVPLDEIPFVVDWTFHR